VGRKNTSQQELGLMISDLGNAAFEIVSRRTVGVNGGVKTFH
jgi:hypothetical protein